MRVGMEMGCWMGSMGLIRRRDSCRGLEVVRVERTCLGLEEAEAEVEEEAGGGRRRKGVGSIVWLDGWTGMEMAAAVEICIRTAVGLLRPMLQAQDSDQDQLEADLVLDSVMLLVRVRIRMDVHRIMKGTMTLYLDLEQRVAVATQ